MKIRTLLRLVERGQPRSVRERAIERAYAHDLKLNRQRTLEHGSDLIGRLFILEDARALELAAKYKKSVKRFGVDSKQAEKARKNFNLKAGSSYQALRKGRFTPTEYDEFGPPGVEDGPLG